jgi:hypothetical protein
MADARSSGDAGKRPAIPRPGSKAPSQPPDDPAKGKGDQPEAEPKSRTVVSVRGGALPTSGDENADTAVALPPDFKDALAKLEQNRAHRREVVAVGSEVPASRPPMTERMPTEPPRAEATEALSRPPVFAEGTLAAAGAPLRKTDPAKPLSPVNRTPAPIAVVSGSSFRPRTPAAGGPPPLPPQPPQPMAVAKTPIPPQLTPQLTPRGSRPAIPATNVPSYAPPTAVSPVISPRVAPTAMSPRPSWTGPPPPLPPAPAPPLPHPSTPKAFSPPPDEPRPQAFREAIRWSQPNLTGPPPPPVPSPAASAPEKREPRLSYEVFTPEQIARRPYASRTNEVDRPAQNAGPPLKIIGAAAAAVVVVGLVALAIAAAGEDAPRSAARRVPSVAPLTLPSALPELDPSATAATPPGLPATPDPDPATTAAPDPTTAPTTRKTRPPSSAPPELKGLRPPPNPYGGGSQKPKN